MKNIDLKQLIRDCDKLGIPIFRHIDTPELQQAAIEVDHEDRLYKNMEREHKKQEKKERMAWVGEMQNTEFAMKARKRYLKQQQKELYEKYKKAKDQKPIEQEIRKIQTVINNIGTRHSVTEVDIEIARESPIEDIVEINSRGYALCVNHEDTRPSMYCKNNYAHCFSCNYNADAIQLYMDINGVSFTTAVKSLKQNI